MDATVGCSASVGDIVIGKTTLHGRLVAFGLQGPVSGTIFMILTEPPLGTHDLANGLLLVTASLGTDIGSFVAVRGTPGSSARLVVDAVEENPDGSERPRGMFEAVTVLWRR